MTRWHPTQRSAVASAVAAAFLAGEWEPAGMEGRAAAMLGRRPRWLGRVAREAALRYREQPADRPRELTAVIERVLLGLDRSGLLPRPPGRVPAGIFRPRMGRMRWPMPAIETLSDLAELLDLHISELRLRSYRYRWLARPSAPPRLIEQPGRLLKETQRRLLGQILERIPAHDAAQGFRRGHSAATHARRHTGCELVLRFDLEDFFASVASGRVYGIFRAAGYP